MKSIEFLDDLVAVGEEQREAANQLAVAAEVLAREANGSRLAVMPAPVAYDVLGNLKVSLALLNEVVRYLPHGLRRSLDDARLAVYDQDPWTGQERDPGRQVASAADHLSLLAGLLDAFRVVFARADRQATGRFLWRVTRCDDCEVCLCRGGCQKRLVFCCP